MTPEFLAQLHLLNLLHAIHIQLFFISVSAGAVVGSLLARR